MAYTVASGRESVGQTRRAGQEWRVGRLGRALGVSVMLLAGGAPEIGFSLAAHAQVVHMEAVEAAALEPFIQEIPVAAMGIEMVPIAGDEARGIAPFWISKTELTWPAFDVFVYRLDETGEPTGSDVTTRPSKPYLPPDRGFGHDGYAAISMSFLSAQMYCAWLSEKTGKKYRLPTEAEWELACGEPPLGADLDAFAWYAENADGKPQRVGTKAPNAHGLHDMLGNVQEWCVDADGKPVTKGGSYRDEADGLSREGRQTQSFAWNSSDPQIPKSKWWLSDGPFVGFRVVREGE